jgi:hypothetical protein
MAGIRFAGYKVGVESQRTQSGGSSTLPATTSCSPATASHRGSHVRRPSTSAPARHARQSTRSSSRARMRRYWPAWSHISPSSESAGAKSLLLCPPSPRLERALNLADGAVDVPGQLVRPYLGWRRWRDTASRRRQSHPSICSRHTARCDRGPRRTTRAWAIERSLSWHPCPVEARHAPDERELLGYRVGRGESSPLARFGE